MTAPLNPADTIRVEHDDDLGWGEPRRPVERVNHAMTRHIVALPDGLYLLRDIGDKFAILYPAKVLCAIQGATDERLRLEKSECVKALDEVEQLREELERSRTAAARAQADVASLREALRIAGEVAARPKKKRGAR